MALEVHLPHSSTDFDFDFDFNRGRASPILSTPSSPTRFGGFFFSTPTTPARGSENVHGEYETIRSPLIYQQQQQQSPARRASQSKNSSSSNNNNNFQSVSRSRGVWGDLEVTALPLQSKNSKSYLWSTISPKTTNKKSSKVPTELAERPGREDQRRVSSLSTSKSGKREARSLSPERRKWRLKDLLLFRSKSEGHSHSHKDPLKKYSKIGNTRSSSGSQSIDHHHQSSGKRTGAMVSAHELHYKTNKAISEDMRKKSFLPYKQGILGRLAVNPTVHALAHGFGSLAHAR